VPEYINIYYSSGTSWVYIKTVSLPANLPAEGQLIYFDEKVTNGLHLTSYSLREQEGTYHFQIAEINAGSTSCSSYNTSDPSYEWCSLIQSYHINRPIDSDYLSNQYVRIGVNRNFGATIFELYGGDFTNNLILEHGGGAVQLSLWGYNGSESEDRCPVFAHLPVSPWNPLQAQCYNCDWETSENDVDIQYVDRATDPFIYSQKTNPGQFTLKGPFTDLTWYQTVKLGSCFTEITYEVEYNGTRTLTWHPQEIPALFPAWGIKHNYSFYTGTNPYQYNAGSATVITDPQELYYLRLPDRDTYPHSYSSNYYNITENWVCVSDISEDRAITVATFSPLVKEFAIGLGANEGHGYVTPIGDFTIQPGLNIGFTVYIFPYRHDQVVAGKSVRQWIYDLRPEQEAPTGTISINSGMTYTNSQIVTLTLSATDNSGTVSQMRFSNNNITWSLWENYNTTRIWELLINGTSTKTVYVQFKDSIGNSSISYSDTIYLDTNAPTGTITVDYGNVVTFYPTVNLTLSASDVGSGVSQMQFYTNNDWTGWMPYSTSAQVTIPTSSYGNKTVDVRFIDVAGNISPTGSDAVIYTLKGDFDGNQEVNIDDFAIFVDKWLDGCSQNHCQAVDINLDSKVALKDFAEMVENW